jgi:hypothetical protein
VFRILVIKIHYKYCTKKKKYLENLKTIWNTIQVWEYLYNNIFLELVSSYIQYTFFGKKGISLKENVEKR